MKIVDLSRELYHRTPSYPGQPPIIHGIWKTHEEAFVDSGNVHGNSVMYFSMPDHGGTHIDAPRHFGPKGTPINAPESRLSSTPFRTAAINFLGTWSSLTRLSNSKPAPRSKGSKASQT